jgi:hypothetical protein
MGCTIPFSFGSLQQGGRVANKLLASALISLVCASDVLAAPKHTVQRGGALVVETRFSANLNVQAASLTWQTYDETRPNQKGLATAFRCNAEVAANETNLTLSCKVPLDVADGHYYLTSISIRTNDSEQKYSWYDEPLYVEVQIKGGEAVAAPQIKSVQLKS